LQFGSKGALPPPPPKPAAGAECITQQDFFGTVSHHLSFKEIKTLDDLKSCDKFNITANGTLIGKNLGVFMDDTPVPHNGVSGMPARRLPCLVPKPQVTKQSAFACEPGVNFDKLLVLTERSRRYSLARFRSGESPNQTKLLQCSWSIWDRWRAAYRIRIRPSRSSLTTLPHKQSTVACVQLLGLFYRLLVNAGAVADGQQLHGP
jgi:hypothetical protein